MFLYYAVWNFLYIDMGINLDSLIRPSRFMRTYFTNQMWKKLNLKSESCKTLVQICTMCIHNFKQINLLMHVCLIFDPKITFILLTPSPEIKSYDSSVHCILMEEMTHVIVCLRPSRSFRPGLHDHLVYKVGV